MMTSVFIKKCWRRHSNFLNYSRTETDDSSFYPHASSSRRLSSDIFSDQQSQDSFFVTKNKTESVNPASLGVIPEVTQQDITDITPSGDIRDFDSSTGINNVLKKIKFIYCFFLF